MSHVDEGLLHALLDGALEGSAELPDIEGHLEHCAECRARLAEARTLRDRTAGLLDGVPAGDIVMPPFAEVVARRGPRTKRPTVFRMNRLAGLGWAATIALAVGIGWLARGSFQTPRSTDRPMVASAPAEQPAEPEAARQLQTDVAASEERESVGGVSAATRGASESRQEVQAAPTAPPAAEPAVVADLAEGAVTGEPVAAAKAGRGEPDRADEAADVVQIAAEAPAPSRLQAEAARRERTAANEMTARDLVEGGTWQESDAESAAAYLTTAVLSVPGVDIRRVETGVVFGEAAVRVTQQVGRDSLVIVQYRTPDAEALSGLAAGIDAAGAGYPVALRRSGVTALLRGSVTTDSLRRLAERIP